ncbi:MAG: hypothetical protein FD120_2833 [Gammaproteobacteria bacterium]|nr:MAG: hypothetical protein FD120_2833 [Gammaproteobacteria bacterium]
MTNEQLSAAALKWAGTSADARPNASSMRGSGTSSANGAGSPFDRTPPGQSETPPCAEPEPESDDSRDSIMREHGFVHAAPDTDNVRSLRRSSEPPKFSPPAPVPGIPALGTRRGTPLEPSPPPQAKAVRRGMQPSIVDEIMRTAKARAGLPSGASASTAGPAASSTASQQSESSSLPQQRATGSTPQNALLMGLSRLFKQAEEDERIRRHK